MATDGSPIQRSYLRFDVSGVTGTVQSARLRLYAFSSTVDGPAVYLTGNGWEETTITWNNKPSPIGAASDDKGAINRNNWVEFDVKLLVTGNGTFSFALVSTSSDGVEFYSREGSQLPQLVVTFVGQAVIGTPTATPTATSTPTATATPTNTPTSTPIPTATGSPTSATFVAVADAYVEERNSSTNFGTSNQLATDGSPVQRSYLRFDVSGITGTVQNARLRLYAFSSTVDGPAVYLTGNGWEETTITWNNKPSPIGAPSDDRGAINRTNWVEFDVKPLVTGNGTFSFVLVSTSSDGLEFSSREGSQPPQLVVAFAP